MKRYRPACRFSPSLVGEPIERYGYSLQDSVRPLRSFHWARSHHRRSCKGCGQIVVTAGHFRPLSADKAIDVKGRSGGPRPARKVHALSHMNFRTWNRNRLTTQRKEVAPIGEALLKMRVLHDAGKKVSSEISPSEEKKQHDESSSLRKRGYIADVASMWTGVPVQQDTETGPQRLLHLEKPLT